MSGAQRAARYRDRFLEFYDLTFEEAYRYAGRLCGSDHNGAEDLVHDAYTSLLVESVEVLAGNGQVSEIGLSSWWAHTDRDPLADAITFNGVNFVGFLSAMPNKYGTWSPAVEGFVFGCGTTSSQTSSWSGHPPESAGISLDALAAEVRAIASAG